MAFGFDPSIILAGKPATLSDMLEPARQYQAMQQAAAQHQATLGALLQKQQQEAALRSIYQRNADSPDNLQAALMRGGFGDEAAQWGSKRSEEMSREAAAKKSMQDTIRQRLELLSRPIQGGIKSQQDLDRAHAAWRASGLTDVELHGIPTVFDEQAVPILDSIAKMGISAEKQAELAQKDRAAGMRVVDTGTGQRYAFNQETGQYDIPVGKPKPVKTGGGGGAPSVDGSVGGWSKDAIEREATAYNLTHKMPSIGNNKESGVIKAAIAKRAAELAAGIDDAGLAGSAADYTASTASLKKLQTQADFVESFENTALKNLDTALSAAEKVPDAGTGLLNAPLRSWANKAGSPEVARFKSALATARQEISKVLSGSTGSGGVTEGQRHEVESLMSDDLTLAQLKATAEILKTDMANRKVAVSSAIKDIRGRLGGKKSAPEAAKEPAADPDVVLVMPPGGTKPVPVHRANVPEALRRGGKLVTPGEVAANGG